MKLIADGFGNALLSLGFGTKDKSRNFQFNIRDRFDYYTLDYLYAQLGIVKKIVNIISDDMIREGIDFISDNSDKFIEIYKQLDIIKHINKALKYSILHGGSACVLLINDGREYNEPIDFSNIKSIDGIVTLDMHYLQPKNGYKAFEPIDIWNVGLKDTIQEIHSDRILYFDGEDCGERLRASNNGHGESFIWCVWEAIENYYISHNTAPNLLIQLSQGVYKIKGLNTTFATKNAEAQNKLENRMSIINAMRSINNMMCIDSEEDFNIIQTNLSNVDKVINQSERRLCADVDIPHSRLLQESAGASLGESGNNQKRDHYDNIKGLQERKLRPNLEKLNKILAFLMKTDIPNFEFNSLWQLSELDKAKVQETMSKVDDTYNKMGLSSEDILKSRFGDRKYSINTVWSGKIENNNNMNNTSKKEPVNVGGSNV